MAEKVILFTLVSAIVDFAVSSALLVHFNKPSMFSRQFFKYEFCSSSPDLWLLSLSRTTLLIGTVVGIIRNKRQAIARVASLKKPVLYLSIGAGVFTVVKFLLSTECDLHKSTRQWLWCFFAWSVVCTAGTNCLWHWLSKKRNATTSSISTEGEIGSVLEQERLLDDEDRDSDDSEGEQGISAWRLLAYSKPDMSYLILAILCLLAAATGEIFIPYYTGLVIDGIAIEKDKKKFHNSILIMFLISLATAIFTGLRGALFTLISAKLNIRISNDLFGSILKQDIGFFDNTKTGDIVSRLTSDTSKMSEQVGLNINVFLRNIFQSIGTCVFMFKLSWKLSIVVVVGLPLVALVSEVYGEYYKKISAAVQDAVAKANEVAAEVVSAMKTVRSFANEDGELASYKNKQRSVLKLYFKKSVLFGGYRWCTEILALALDVVALLYGGHLVLRGELSGGNLVSFILYQLQLGFYIEEIADIYTGLMEAIGASKKVFELIDRRPDIQNNGTIKPAEFSGDIEFQHVSFAYPSRPDVPVLNDVSFKVNSGDVVALVGASGGGKSTCINLLEHFYESSSGQVLVDSIPVQNFDHKHIHTKVALVGQEPVLFARSIRENITYGLENDMASVECVEHASRLSNAYDFISEMPEGYETQSGEKGLQLSGGQKQRVAVARALARNPKVLLLDEATSALDAESEHLVQDAIYRNLKGHTVLIIAHRLSTIERADQIIVIDQGRVMEQGKHLELLQRNGLYAKLVQRQMLGQTTCSLEGQEPTYNEGICCTSSSSE